MREPTESEIKKIDSWVNKTLSSIDGLIGLIKNRQLQLTEEQLAKITQAIDAKADEIMTAAPDAEFTLRDES